MRLLLALAAALAPLAAHAAPTVWAAHSTVKILPTDAPGSSADIAISAAQNEFEVVQVGINGGSGGASGVSISPFVLNGPNGATIGAGNIWLYREALLTTQYASNSEVQPGTFPDALVPDVDEVVGETRNAFPFDVPPGENRAVWIDILVPKTATPGQYTGTATVSGSGFSQSVNITLTVWPFALPSTSSLKSTFGIMWDGPCQENWSDGYNDPLCGDSGTHQNRALWSAWFLDHRLTVDAIYTGPSSSNTGYDWASWDAIYGPLFDGTANTRLIGAKQTTIRYSWTGDQAHYAEWAQHFRQKGWFDRTYDYTCDEPPATCQWSDIPTRAAMIHGADPEFRTLVTTNVDDATSNGVLSSIDIISPVVNQVDDKSGMPQSGNQRSKYDGYIQNGGELFWYQSCMSEGCGPGQPNSGGKGYDPYFTGWPMIQVDAPAVRNRAEEWLSYVYGIQGELYYFTDQAESSGMDPYSDQWIFGGNGDGTIVYPGRPSQIGGSTPIPVASIRLKLIREGMEDYEYLKLCSDLGDSAFAMQQALTVVTDTHTINGDPTAMDNAREALAQRIVQLLNPSATCSDGTQANACSATQPMKCTGGVLVNDCATCGCASGLLCQSDGSCSSTPPAGQYSAQQLAGPATVDGQLAEYEGLPTMNLGGSTAQAAWDSTNLYLAFDVHDADLVPSDGLEQDVWSADSVEVMIDADSSGGATADADDVHVLIDVGGNLADSTGWSNYAFTSHTTFAVDLEGGAPGQAATGTGYRVELAIPWSSIGLSPQTGLHFGFDVAVNNKDLAGSLTSTDWIGLTAFNHPAAWGTLTLVPGPVTGTTTSTSGTTSSSNTSSTSGGTSTTGSTGTSTTGGAGSTTGGNGNGSGAAGGTTGAGPISGPSSGCSTVSDFDALALLGLALVLRRRRS